MGPSGEEAEIKYIGRFRCSVSPGVTCSDVIHVHVTDALGKKLRFPTVPCSGAGHVESVTESAFVEIISVIFGVWYNEAGL